MFLSCFKPELKRFENNAEIYLYHNKTFGGVPLAGILKGEDRILLLTKKQAKNTGGEIIPATTKDELLQVLGDLYRGKVCMLQDEEEKEVVFVCGSSFQSKTIWLETYVDNDQTDLFVEALTQDYNINDVIRRLHLLGFPADAVRKHCKKHFAGSPLPEELRTHWDSDYSNQYHAQIKGGK